MLTRMPYTVRAPLVKRAVAWGLTLAMLCPPMSGLLSAAQAQAPVESPNSPTRNGAALPPPLPVVEPIYGANSILLFPFVNDTNNPAADAISGQVTDAVKLRVSLLGSYQVTSYSKFLSPVQRALDDNVLTQSDIAGPFDQQKAGRIATQVQTDAYLTGAIESYKIDSSGRRVTVEVSADLRSTRTKNSIRTLAFTGTGVPFSNSDTIEVLTQRAVNAVASRLTAAIYPGKAAPQVVASSSRGHSKAGQAFLVTLLSGALLYAILHNSGSSGGGSGSTTTGGVGTGGTGGTGGTTTGGPPSPPTVP